MNQPLPSISARAEDLDAHPPARALPRARRGRGLLLLALTVLLGLFLLGYVPKQRKLARLSDEAAALATRLPRVALLRPVPSPRSRTLTLPATLKGLEETVLYARADGYVSALRADIGDDVRAGATLAELDNPEVDREIQQASANLASTEALLLRAHAAREHSALDFARYKSMTPGLIAQQDLDQKRTAATLDQADVAVAEAACEASRANLARLRQLKAFSRVVAPFAGTITARTIERGALVARGKDSPLFKLASLDTLRVLGEVPQSKVAGVMRGQRATVAVPEYPGQSFEGVVTRTAGALDSGSRTMNIEIQVQNAERKLLPGMFASLTLELRSSAAALTIPATALIIDEHGTHVASVDAQGRVHLLAVAVEHDHGAEVEIGSGLRGDEALIANPGPAIGEGSRVQLDKS